MWVDPPWQPLLWSALNWRPLGMTWDDRQGTKRKQLPEDTNNIEQFCHTFWILLVLVCCRQEAVCWLSVFGRISVDLCYKPQMHASLFFLEGSDCGHERRSHQALEQWLEAFQPLTFQHLFALSLEAWEGWLQVICMFDGWEAPIQFSFSTWESWLSPEWKAHWGFILNGPASLFGKSPSETLSRPESKKNTRTVAMMSNSNLHQFAIYHLVLWLSHIVSHRKSFKANSG